MTPQQINLHQPIFRKQRALFSSAIVVRICGVFVLALAAIYAYAQWRDGELARQQSQLVKYRDSETARMQELVAGRTSVVHDSSLQAQIARLQDDVARKESLVKVLGRGDLGDTVGFAAQIDALAERRTEGVWLTHVVLSEGGRQIALHGTALSEKLVPEYLERLADEHGSMDGFTGTRFAQVKLLRSKEASSIEFTFDTQAAAGDRAP